MLEDFQVDGVDLAVNMVKEMEMRDNAAQSRDSPRLDTNEVVRRRDNRKADRRRIVATYTRAYLKTAGVRLPTRRTHGKGVAVGNDAFLRWAYGRAFQPGSLWHDLADHEFFFRFLVRRATGMRDLQSVRVHEFFAKKQSTKSAPWTFCERTFGTIKITACALRTVAEEMRGVSFS